MTEMLVTSANYDLSAIVGTCVRKLATILCFRFLKYIIDLYFTSLLCSFELLGEDTRFLV